MKRGRDERAKGGVDGGKVTRQLGDSPVGSSREQIDTLTLKRINHIVAFQKWSQIADMVRPAVPLFFFSA